MRRSLITALALALVVTGLVPAQAAKKKTTRVAEADYFATMCVETVPCAFWKGSPLGNFSAVEFPMGVGEKYVSIEVFDQTGQPVRGGINVDGDGSPETQETSLGTFCGKTEKPIKVVRGPITVFVGSGTCDGQPAVATYGTVKATFSNVP